MRTEFFVCLEILLTLETRDNVGLKEENLKPRLRQPSPAQLKPRAQHLVKASRQGLPQAHPNHLLYFEGRQYRCRQRKSHQHSN